MMQQKNRLYFLDAIRAFAILMMLQGHFVDSLLDPVYRDSSKIGYTIWEYFRGNTAPIFFTITGFVFVYLLLKQNAVGFNNPRVIKGAKRALKLVFWGYMLRLSMHSIIYGSINPSFYYVDVLQCIGSSILLLIALYLGVYTYSKRLFQYGLVVLGILIFLFQPMYDMYILNFLPETIANYFTQRYGSVFTLIPWFGYLCFGGFLAMIFMKYGERKQFNLYVIIGLLLSGIIMIFYSSNMFMFLFHNTNITLFKSVASNNFLFIRLGNVSLIFALFIMMRNYLSIPVVMKIGSKTLSIYIIHFVILYGSWFGLGLNSIFYHSLNPTEVIFGALLFVVSVSLIVLYYYKHENYLVSLVAPVKNIFFIKSKLLLPKAYLFVKNRTSRKQE